MTTLSSDLLIGGDERADAETFPVYDPAHAGTVIGHASAASAADALDAVRAAYEAWPAWAARAATERTQLVLAALEGLGADADERAEILSRENGKIRFAATIDARVFEARFHQAAQLDHHVHIEGRRSRPRSRWFRRAW